MRDLETFLEIFGHLTLADIGGGVVAVGFLVYIGVKAGKFINKKKELMIQKHEAEQEKNKQLKEALESVKKYPEWRQQSIQIQQKLEGEIRDLRETQQQTVKQLQAMEENINRRERNKLRNRLLESFRYYTNELHNPLQAWTRMESEAFWELFKDYEDANGNGYVHTEVRPAMNKLEIIELTDTERVAELMKSRR